MQNQSNLIKFSTVVLTAKDKPEEIPIELDQVMSTVDRPDVFTVVGMNFPIRLGITTFITMVEYGLFHPSNTALNRQLSIILAEWQGMHYFIMTVPRRSFQIVNEWALKCGLRLSHKSTQVMMTAQGMLSFPIHGNGIFMAENLSGHWVYSMSQSEIHAAAKTEHEFAQKVWMGERILLNTDYFTKFKVPLRMRGVIQL